MTSIEAVNQDYISVSRSKKNQDGSTTQEVTKYTDPKLIEIFKKADLNKNNKIDTKEEMAKFDELKAEQEKTTNQLDSLKQALGETDVSLESEDQAPAQISKDDFKQLFEMLASFITGLLGSFAKLMGGQEQTGAGQTTGGTQSGGAAPINPTDKDYSVEVNKIMKKFDKNRDGFSSKEERENVKDGVSEANSYLSNAKEIDKNGNVKRNDIDLYNLKKKVTVTDPTTGKTEVKEVEADKTVKEVMRSYDKNHDGKLDASEQVSMERDLGDVKKLLKNEKDQDYVKIGQTGWSYFG